MKGEQMPLSKVLGLSSFLTAPPQSFGAMTLIPVLRKDPSSDLRIKTLLGAQQEEAPKEEGGKSARYAYVPHGLIIDWTEDGSPVVAFGTQIFLEGESSARKAPEMRAVNLVHAHVGGRAQNNPRFAPMELTMEGFVSFLFGANRETWREYAEEILQGEVIPRWEWSTRGRPHPALEDAFRAFEIHEEQTGILLFIEEEFASAFITPHPEDYRVLHHTLLEDVYGGALVRFGRRLSTSDAFSIEAPGETIRSLEQMRISLKSAKARWSVLRNQAPHKSFERQVFLGASEKVGPFTRRSFMSALSMQTEGVLGEVIQRDSGRVEYVKTYRLSKGEAQRTYFVESLARNNWNLKATASSLGISEAQLASRLQRAGFSYLLKDKVLNSLRKEALGGKRRRR